MGTWDKTKRYLDFRDLTDLEREVLRMLAKKGPLSGPDLWKTRGLMTEEGWRKMRIHLTQMKVIEPVDGQVSVRGADRFGHGKQRRYHWLSRDKGITLAVRLLAEETDQRNKFLGAIEALQSKIIEVYPKEPAAAILDLVKFAGPKLTRTIFQPRPLLPGALHPVVDELTEQVREFKQEASARGKEANTGAYMGVLILWVEALKGLAHELGAEIDLKILEGPTQSP